MAAPGKPIRRGGWAGATIGVAATVRSLPVLFAAALVLGHNPLVMLHPLIVLLLAYVAMHGAVIGGGVGALCGIYLGRGNRAERAPTVYLGALVGLAVLFVTLTAAAEQLALLWIAPTTALTAPVATRAGNRFTAKVTGARP